VLNRLRKKKAPFEPMDLGDPKLVARLLGHFECLSYSLQSSVKFASATAEFSEHREQKDIVQRHTGRPESNEALANLCQAFVSVSLNSQDPALQDSTSRKILGRDLVLSAQSHHGAGALSGQILLPAAIVKIAEKTLSKD
jgi:hypothetical protein